MNGGLPYKKSTLGAYGDDPQSWQQRHGTGAGENPAASWDNRLATQSAVVRQTGFYFQTSAARTFCGRLFLAWLPKTFALARQQSIILEE